ncbi:MAG: PilZ domain-containing protein [Desulfobulbaceae bacterium]|nr:PilZ domain-containing protein [Desulfobulbaceae bacterium]
MRKLWTNVEEKIREEIETAVTDKVPFNLFQADQPPRPLRAQEITEKNGSKLIIFSKGVPFNTNKETCYLVYRRQGQMMRGFNGIPLLETPQLLAMSFPAEIFQIQRRKHPRIKTPGKSQAAIALEYTQRLNIAAVIDISMEGAKLIGKLSPRIRTGDIIGPITFTLHMRVATLNIDTLSIPKAKVVRVSEVDDETREIGLHFKVAGEERSTLEHYLQLRTIEDAAGSGGKTE